MFEEVKEMIDSTIYTNGRGEVTAQNVNLAMHGMVDATEEELGKVNDAVKAVEDKVTALEENGIGGGSGALKVWMPIEDVSTELTPEQIAENVATYNEIVKGEPVSVVLCQGGSVDGMTVAGTIPTTASYTDLGSNKMVVLLANQIFDREIASITGQLCSDGSAVMVTKTFDVPAPSGQLYLNGDSSHDQDVYNVVFSALSNMEPCPQILMMDSGICASSITVWLDNNLVQNGVAISFYIPTDGGYVTFILSPDGSITPQAA